MNMNKKGFTLVELLATMVILAIIAGVAIPNVIKIMSNNEKEKVLNDGLTMIAQAKGILAGDYDLREQIRQTGASKVIYLYDLDKYGDISNDPKGTAYNRNNSYVKVFKSGNLIAYCAYLESNNWVLKNGSSCVNEDKLLTDDAKSYVNEK